VTPSVLPGEDAACGEVPVGTVVVRSGRGDKDRVMLLPKIRYKGPFYILLGRLHIDSDTDNDIANVQRSLGLVDEHDVTWTRPLSTRRREHGRPS
jgi:hypothetical protein